VRGGRVGVEGGWQDGKRDCGGGIAGEGRGCGSW
jgi:hypothetical protein